MEPLLGFITPTTAVIILIIALIIFGPGKLPELGKGLGRGIKEFKSATDGDEKKGKEEPKALPKTDSTTGPKVEKELKTADEYKVEDGVKPEGEPKS